MEEERKEKGKVRKWAERLGMGAFLFFTIKGLIWLAIFFGAAKVIGC